MKDYSDDQKPGETPDPSKEWRSGRTGVVDHEEGTSGPKAQTGRQGQKGAVDEARQMLDEIAGLDHSYRASRPARPDTARTVRTILLWPVLAVWAVLKLVLSPLRRADFKLVGEMRKFLQHPGHFFWFNRIAPDAAAQHFGTSSTDAMTHHARRYGAHSAMLVLAVVVVVFGGFSGLATKIMSAYADVPEGKDLGANLTLTSDGREIYASAVASNSTAFTRRVSVETVKGGDTLRSIAAAKNLSLDTLTFANNIDDPDAAITPGQKLVIPPVTGMLHIVNPGDTVGKIADIYGVDPQVILTYQFNGLEGTDASIPLKPLQEVMVPGGSRPLRSKLYMYSVLPKDTLKSVSDKFGLKADTLLDNNDLDGGLRPGQQIRILPVDGVIYKVKKGDTVDSIARYLGTTPENIINFRPNNIARGVAMEAGYSLIVPGGAWPPPPPPEPEAPPAPVKVKPAANAPASSNPNVNKAAPAVAPLPQQPTPAAAKPAPAKPTTPVQQKPSPVKPAAPGQVVQKPAPAAPVNSGRATGKMIWPLVGPISTYFGQPIWYGIHQGLDIAPPCGSRIIAADGGTAVIAGWDGGYGNSVLLDHGGGIRTRYGHFASLAVGLGQRVNKGQVIGYEGSTGNSTGCHLHFEVVVGGRAVDPLRWLP